MRHRTSTTILAALAFVTGVTVGDATAGRRTLDNPYPGYQSATYADPAHWLCRPDKDDVCDHDLDATVVKANGRVKREKFRPARKPKIDTNPAALAGGVGTLHPYFSTDGAFLPIITVPPPQWVDPSKNVTITTDFVTLPKFVDAECAEKDGFVYLSLIVNSDSGDPRIDDIGGDITPDWGMHLIDASVAMGDLVKVAHDQARGYRRR